MTAARDDVHAEYADEARARWGHTGAWRESARRTRGYSEEDWARIRAESDGILVRLAALLGEGTSPAAAGAMDLAEEHRLHIDRWFYPCDHDMHSGLAELYTADARFADHFEAHRPGLATFVADTIRANADRARSTTPPDG